VLTIAAFIFAIALLVAVHEWGHFAMARFCGVRVLRFSIGFGPRLMGWTSQYTATEFVVCALPLGGYVKMLDERDGVVDANMRAYAFNSQPLKKRAAIVMAGPLANLLLAALIYSLVNWIGMDQPQARLSMPIADSVAQRAGFQGRERVLAVAFDNENAIEVTSFDDFRWWLTRAALGHRNLKVELQQDDGLLVSRTLELASMESSNADGALFRSIGLVSPYSPAQLGDVVIGGAAERAGLISGDVILAVDDLRIVDANQLRDHIRNSGRNGLISQQKWLIKRNFVEILKYVTPMQVTEQGRTIGRISAVVGAMPDMVTVRYGFFDGIYRSVARTWELSVLTLKMMGQIATGQSSLKNLSGPLTIADYAGKSASMGATQFAIFLALVSVSLGVLNLLPLPILDGGHLVYYLWEFFVGSPISDSWMDRLQRVGLVVLMVMMSIAVFNDITRLLG
jgi:regulator of sigma E protease